MFNIRNLVSRISQVKDGETSDTSSNKSRSASQASSAFADEGVPVEAEGFLCPTCMAAFPSADSLQSHYEKEHLEPGANYLCPVCKARLENASELELHYSAHHSASRSSGDVEALVQEINTLTSSLSDERWSSEELRKEVSLLKEMLNAQGSGEEQKMYQQQIEGLSETKSLLTSEVVLLRKQLAEAIESTLQLKQGRDKLEEKTARHSQTVVQLQSALDENVGLIAALQDNIKELESQLTHKSGLGDDAEALKKELSSVQNLMVELTTAKEKELDELRTALNDVQMENQALKNKADLTNQTNDTSSPVLISQEHLDRIQQLEQEKERLEKELIRQKEETEEARKISLEKNDQVLSLQHIREETDVCVGQLRQEVTSLQEMLNQARHQAEGQVSAKDDELMRFKLDLSKHREQVEELEMKCHNVQKSHDQLANSLSQREREIQDRNQTLSSMNVKLSQQEEKIQRLEQEKEELLATIQKGQGADTAIQQLQQDNSRLQDELTGMNAKLSNIEAQHRIKEEDLLAIEKSLRDKIGELQADITSSSKDLESSRNKTAQLESSLEGSKEEIQNLHLKCNDLDSEKRELENILINQKKQLEDQTTAMTKLETDLKCTQEKLANAQQFSSQLEVNFNQLQGHKEVLEKSVQELEMQVNQLKSLHEEDAKRADHLQSALTERNTTIQQLQQRLTELEPLTEEIEHEKLRRIKEKAEWGEHEQLLRGEKESLATLTTHLQQQLDEQTTEHRIHLQRLKNETESLLKDKTQLSEQLSQVKDGRAKDVSVWTDKCNQLEEEIKSLKIRLSAAEDLSATRYQRCEELQASSDKYQTLKIELETRLALFEEEKLDLQNSCSQWENEVDRLKFNAAELRRRLEDSQAALHELGRENQSLQMENAKLQGRKWADDSEVVDCHTCQKSFNITVRKHHCRNCGQIFCNECSSKSTAVGNSRKPVRVCDSCFKELTINSPR